MCCVAPSFSSGDDFAFDKPAGVRCPNLQADCGCAIYGEREVSGFAGCALYDCYGAGQRVTRAFPDLQGEAAEPARSRAFLLLRELHELLWLLTEAAKVCPPGHAALRGELAQAIATLDASASEPAALSDGARDMHQTHGRALLLRVGEALGGRRGQRALPVLS
jgi:hypothetical protein